jgi:tetratricopeptide (TPR) repeat protein
MSDRSTDSQARSWYRNPALLPLLLGGITVVGLMVWVGRSTRESEPPKKEPPGTKDNAAEWTAVTELPWPDSPYENTGRGVEYVGSDTCRECHSAEFETYLSTAHSESLRATSPDAEPQDGELVHDPSRRRYQVHRDESGLYHRELLLLPDGSELESYDLKLAYTVGSGRFGRTYLAEVDGYFIESPVTWYTPREAWGMSPGYEGAHQQSFRRVVPAGCFFCHAGDVGQQEGNPTQLTIREEAIGCERCHGPGSLHVARQRAGEGPAGKRDMTIVNPAHLTRSLQEAVCAQCHVQGDARATVRDRKMSEFRPGLPLEHFRVEYWLQPDEQMSIVGHHAQLHQSRCYTQSDSMSCLTCHTPHKDVPPDRAAGHYRSVCSTCHSEGSCGLPPDERQMRAANDCTQCHMPKAATEVPHVAFTHHRIGVHVADSLEPAGPYAEATDGALVAIDTPDLPELERIRLRGLAHAQQFRKLAFAPAGREYHRRATSLLEQALNQGAGDRPVRSALAELTWFDRHAERAKRLAESVTDESDVPSQELVEANAVLADMAFRSQDFVRARDLYAQLADVRHNAYYWFCLGLCEQNLGHREAAVQSLQQSLRIDPVQTGAHDMLAALYRFEGDALSEQYHRQMSHRLSGFIRRLAAEVDAAVENSALPGR